MLSTKVTGNMRQFCMRKYDNLENVCKQEPQGNYFREHTVLPVTEWKDKQNRKFTICICSRVRGGGQRLAVPAAPGVRDNDHKRKFIFITQCHGNSLRPHQEKSPLPVRATITRFKCLIILICMKENV